MRSWIWYVCSKFEWKRYHNDMLICRWSIVTGSNQSEIEKLKHTMQCDFEMIDLGKLSYFLGLEYKASKIWMIMH